MTRLFQFLLLLQTVIWIFSELGMDKRLEVGIHDFHVYWVISYACILSLAIFNQYLALFSWLVQIVSEKVYSRKLLRIIKELNPQDKHILSQFVIERKREVFLNPLDESVEWLTFNKILIKTGSSVEKKYGYKLALWARDRLIKNPNFLY